MVLLALPTLPTPDTKRTLASKVLSALRPSVVVSDGSHGWAKDMAEASFDFDLKLVIAQPWDIPLSSKYGSFTKNVFYDNPVDFFRSGEKYFDWLTNFVTDVSVTQDNHSSFTHLYLVKFQNVYFH